MPVIELLDRLDHRFVGRPEADYVFESRKWRLRLGLIVLLTLLSLTIATTSNAPTAGWVLTLFAVATFVRTILARRTWRRTAVQTVASWRDR